MTIRHLLCCCVLLCSLYPGVSTAESVPEVAWPDAINNTSGFQSLGWAIKASKAFPADGTDVEKARFVAEQLPVIAARYKLKTGDGSKLSDAVIGFSRLLSNTPIIGYSDPEDTAFLNGTLVGIGDCAEWSYAFAEILNGAGVGSHEVAFADKTPNPGDFAGGYTGTDTMVVITEKDKSGRWSRRVFDAFQAASNGNSSVPTAYTVKDWTDVPLDACDRWKDEPAVETWLKKIGKPYVKNSSFMTMLESPASARVTANAVNRPVHVKKGRNWVLKDVKVYPADPMDTGPTWRHGSTQSADNYKYELWSVSETDGSLEFDNKFEFKYDSPPAMLMPGETITLTVKGTASIGPHSAGSRFTNWGSYSVSGIPYTTTDPAYVGVWPDERGMITTASSTITIKVPATGGEDTVVIMEHYDKGVLAEYTYKRGG